jgi:hypothetical protein
MPAKLRRSTERGRLRSCGGTSNACRCKAVKTDRPFVASNGGRYSIRPSSPRRVLQGKRLRGGLSRSSSNCGGHRPFAISSPRKASCPSRTPGTGDAPGSDGLSRNSSNCGGPFAISSPRKGSCPSRTPGTGDAPGGELCSIGLTDGSFSLRTLSLPLASTRPPTDRASQSAWSNGMPDDWVRGACEQAAPGAPFSRGERCVASHPHTHPIRDAAGLAFRRTPGARLSTRQRLSRYNVRRNAASGRELDPPPRHDLTDAPRPALPGLAPMSFHFFSRVGCLEGIWSRALDGTYSQGAISYRST